MAKMNWKKARQFRSSEEKYEPGTVLKNGRVVPAAPRDPIGIAAAKAERKWVESGCPQVGPKPIFPHPSEANPDESLKSLLHQVVMAVINAGRSDILKGIDDLNAHYNSRLPTVADVVGGRPESAIITGGIAFEDKVYSFSCSRLVSR